MVIRLPTWRAGRSNEWTSEIIHRGQILAKHKSVRPQFSGTHRFATLWSLVKQISVPRTYLQHKHGSLLHPVTFELSVLYSLRRGALCLSEYVASFDGSCESEWHGQRSYVKQELISLTILLFRTLYIAHRDTIQSAVAYHHCNSLCNRII